MKDNVYLQYLESYEIEPLTNTISNIFDDFFTCGLLKPKMKVLLKPNLPTATSPDLAQSTHPNIVRAIADVLSKYNITCLVADSPLKRYSLSNLEEVYVNTGMLEVANLTKCQLNYNFNTVTKPLAEGLKTKSLTLLQEVDNVDAIINIGKLKFDNRLSYLGCMSNLLGLIPAELKTRYISRIQKLKEFNDLLLDVYTCLKDKVVLNVLDGIVALEKDNTPRMLSLLAVGQDPIKVDASVLDILNIDYINTLLYNAQSRKLFDADKPYKLQGEKLDKFKLKDFAFNDFTLDTDINSAGARDRFIKANQQRPSIKGDRCKGCSICSKTCPTNAIIMKYDKNGELYAHIDYSKCIFCHKCFSACPYKVVEVVTPAKFKSLNKEIEKYNDN